MTEPTQPAGATAALCTWLTGLTLDAVPEVARERAKDVILDGLGCALVGAQLPWSRTAVDAVTGFEGRGDAPLIGWGRTTSAPAAALLNGTFIQGFELDDFHPRAPLHSASLVLPALLALAALREMDGRAFLLGAIAGFEVGPRVGLALHGVQMLSRGWHSGAVFGTHAAAAAVGKALGLDAGKFEDALGLAATQSAGLMAAQYEAMSKRMHHGFASRDGFTAAMLAEAGYTGIKRVFERDYGGFLSVFGEGHDPDATQIADGLGERWETQGIVLKPYAAMGGLHGPLDAIFAIAARRPLVPDEIASIDIAMAHAAYHHGWWELERPVTPIGAQMNVAYAVAAAILDGAAMVQQFAPQRIDQDDVWALIPKIRARHDPPCDTGRIGSVNMTVRFADGSEETEHVASPRTVARPLSREETIDKFRVLTDGIVETARRERIVEQVLGIEALGSARELADTLAGAVGSTFE